MNKFLSLILPVLILFACAGKQEYQTTRQADIDCLTKSAAFSMPRVALPQFADRTFSVLDYGADPTGVALSTDAIQRAIDDCSTAGGGTVVIPEGIYHTAPLTLKSNVRLYTDYNCFVLFSHDLNLYDILDEWFEGIPTKRCTSPLNAFNAENIAITGHGTFNGNGDWWRPVKKPKMSETQWKSHLREKGGIVAENNIWYPDSGSIVAQSYCVDQNVPVITDDALWLQVKSFLRPVLLHFVGCKNILLEGVTFENSPAWNVHPLGCENLIVNNVTIRNPWYSQNGDGIDIESCKNVVIANSTFDVGDDAICMKSGKDKPGRDRGIPTENVVVDNCVVYHGHGGFVCGSEMSGGIRNVEVRRNLYIGTDVGLRFKSTRGRGGVVENIFIKDVNMVNIPNEGLIFDLFYGGKGSGEETEEELAVRMNADAPEASEETPAFRNIVIEDVKGANIKRAILFNGLPEMKIQNVTLRNVAISANEGALFRQTDGLILDNVQISVTKGEPMTLAPTVENVQTR